MAEVESQNRLVISYLVLRRTAFLPAGVRSALAPLDPVFWLESFAIVAFGVSWFTKGEGILQDLVPTDG